MSSRSAVVALSGVAVVVAVAACGGGGSDDPDARPQGPCDDVWLEADPPDGVHHPPGTELAWPTNPPSGGPHYFTWMRWNATYDPPAPRGHWVHNTEHGGVVLLFNCPGGCADVVAGLQAVMAARAEDSLCAPPLRTRMLISSDPLLPAGVQVAASAWGRSYTAACFDQPSLAAFVDAAYGHGPESTCAEGSVP
jgi:hypothetical protein